MLMRCCLAMMGIIFFGCNALMTDVDRGTRGETGSDGDTDVDVDGDADADADADTDADADAEDDGWPATCPGVELSADGVLDLDVRQDGPGAVS